MPLQDAMGAVERGGVTIGNGDLVEGLDAGLGEDDMFEEGLIVGVDDANMPNTAYVEEALRDWDEELLESLDRVVDAFSSADNLDAALEDGIFAGATIVRVQR